MASTASSMRHRHHAHRRRGAAVRRDVGADGAHRRAPAARVARGLGGLAFGRGLGDLVAQVDRQRLVGRHGVAARQAGGGEPAERRGAAVLRAARGARRRCAGDRRTRPARSRRRTPAARRATARAARRAWSARARPPRASRRRRRRGSSRRRSRPCARPSPPRRRRPAARPAWRAASSATMARLSTGTTGTPWPEGQALRDGARRAQAGEAAGAAAEGDGVEVGEGPARRAAAAPSAWAAPARTRRRRRPGRAASMRQAARDKRARPARGRRRRRRAPAVRWRCRWPAASRARPCPGAGERRRDADARRERERRGGRRMAKKCSRAIIGRAPDAPVAGGLFDAFRPCPCPMIRLAALALLATACRRPHARRRPPPAWTLPPTIAAALDKAHVPASALALWVQPVDAAVAVLGLEPRLRRQPGLGVQARDHQRRARHAGPGLDLEDRRVRHRPDAQRRAGRLGGDRGHRRSQPGDGARVAAAAPAARRRACATSAATSSSTTAASRPARARRPTSTTRRPSPTTCCPTRC